MPKNSTGELAWREARFNCMRRSTLELETLLLDYFEKEWKSMDEKARIAFVKILKAEDADLERYLFKNHPPPPEFCKALIEKLREHSPK
jgi:succinate dehydrogenase flavin-adding protein (antitoxin of CptAB toxin-antitoxin module)